MKLLAPLIYLAFTPSIAYAYFDPGSGSVMLQVLIAVGLGAFFRFRGWLSSLLRKLAELLRR